LVLLGLCCSVLAEEWNQLIESTCSKQLIEAAD
jgi:hypothetical protein